MTPGEEDGTCRGADTAATTRRYPRIRLVNVLLGGGRRLFDQLPRQVELERTGVTETHGATQLEYQVRR